LKKGRRGFGLDLKVMEKLLEDLKEKIERVDNLSQQYWDCCPGDSYRWDVAWDARRVISEVKEEAKKRGLLEKVVDRIMGWDGKEGLEKEWPTDFTTDRLRE